MVEQASVRVTEAEYVEKYAADFYEWVDGELIPMSPVQLDHDALQDYVRDWLKQYLRLHPIGRVVGAPFPMRLGRSFREPDLQVILHSNPGELTNTAMLGAADICIEIVSPESVERDYADKLSEYQQGGVREYWIFDLKRKDTRFHRLNETGTYTIIETSADGDYSTPLLPRFKLPVATLWLDEKPDTLAIITALRSLLADEST